MIDESNLLNFHCSGIYDSSRAMTETEIIMKVIEKLNLIILNFNNLENETKNSLKTMDKQVNYYLDTGMKIELSKIINDMVEDGTFNSIINQQLFEDLNNQLLNNSDNINALESIVQNNKSELDNEILNNKHLFDEFKNSVEEFIESYKSYKIKLDETINDVENIKEMNNTVKSVDELRAAMLKGGTIYIEPGVYNIPANNPLLYNSFTTVIGKGEVVIKLDPTADNFIMVRPNLSGLETAYSIRNIKFENIIFDGQNSTNKAGLFATCHSKYVTLNECEFKNLKNSWHLVEVNSTDTIDFNRCIFSDYNVGVPDSNGHTEAVQLDFAGVDGQYPFNCLYDNTKTKNVKFNNCKFERITTSYTGAIGSHIKNKDYMPENVTIDGCKFYDVDICVYAPDYHNLILSNNYVYNVATFLVVEPSDDSGKCTITVTDNRYDGSKRSKNIGYMNNTDEGRFIFHLNSQFPLGECEITGNKVYNAYSHGIGITPRWSVINNNIVKFCGKHGIYIYGGQQTVGMGNSCVGNGTLDNSYFKDFYIATGSLGKVQRCNFSNNAAFVTTDGQTYDNTKITNNL